MIYDCLQRTPEWMALRIGKVTGSRVADVLAEIKKGESAARRNYRVDLAGQTLTGLAVEKLVSKEMQWGTDQEPFARAAYEYQQNVMVSSIGFAVHPGMERFGVSPDGFVGDDGLIEIKCPTTATHLGYLLQNEVPADYQPQMLAAMACTGRQWCDFVSFDPRMPPHLQLFVKRFERDNARITEIEGKVEAFLREVDEVLQALAPPPVVLAPDDLSPSYEPEVAQSLLASVPVSRQQALAAEVRACLLVFFVEGGVLNEQIRLAACDLIFHVKAPEALEFLPVRELERGWRILHAYEKFPKHSFRNYEAMLMQVYEAIVEYEAGQNEEWELPF